MIRELRPKYPRLPLVRMCQLLGVPRSAMYRRPNERPERTEFYRSLRLQLAIVLGANPGYGYRRARIELGRRGFACGYKSVTKAMKEGGLNLRRKRKPATSDGLGQGTYPNLLRTPRLIAQDRLGSPTSLTWVCRTAWPISPWLWTSSFAK